MWALLYIIDEVSASRSLFVYDAVKDMIIASAISSNQ